MYLGIRSSNQALNSAKKLAIAGSAEYANIIKGELDAVFKVTRTMANTAATFKLTDWNTFNKIFLETQRNILEKNPAFISVATSWELRYINPNYTKDYGRFLNGYYRKDGQIAYFETYKNLDGDILTSNYYKMKTTKMEMLVDPEYYSYSGKADEMILNSNVSTPVLLEGNYIGLAGVDVDLGYFQKICQKYDQFEQSYAFILSNNGTWVASYDHSLLGSSISKTHQQFVSKHNLLHQIDQGKPFSFIDTDSLGQQTFYAFSPIVTIGDQRPWVVGISVPLNVIKQESRNMIRLVILIGILGFLLLTGIIVFISNAIALPIKHTTHIIKDMAIGKISIDQEFFDRNDEIGLMQQSLKILSDGLNQVAQFAEEIGKGNLDIEFQPRSESDILGKTLLIMRDNLQKAQKEIERQQLEDQKRRWITEGIAKLLQITRTHVGSERKMAYEALKFIISEINGVMGALYYCENETSEGVMFELATAIAYEKQRLVKAKFKPGEGLVGRCGYEKTTIKLTEIPDDYVKVTSGLGEANPNCIILVPMIYNDQVEGVIEVLSFNPFLDHQVEFLEKAAENLAATILSIKTSRKTQELLRQSQEQAEILTQQEEEMRQNIEELHATQEEARKRESEMVSLINVINQVSMIAVYEMDGTLIDINDKFCSVIGLSRQQLIGKKQGSFASQKHDRSQFDQLWRDLRNGKTRQITQDIVINGREMKITEIYSPVLDQFGEPVKVYNIAIEIKK